MKSTEVQITNGSLYKNILIFSIPLAVSNLLQVLFNMSDIAVVGQFAGSIALGSVGSCTTLVSLFTGLLIGMGGGINAIAARYMGADDNDNIKRTVHTAFILSLIYGIAVMIFGLFSVEGILGLLGTKEELMDGAVLYMKVYLLGTPALALYNFGNGVLSASGDSKRSLYYLLTAGILNIILNLFFVIVCNLSVLGVALASAISQYVSAGLVMIHMFHSDKCYSISLADMKINTHIFKNIFVLGISSGLQNAIFAVANLFIQSAVNTFDTVMVEGNSAAANADSLIYDIMNAFYIACTTFMAQNYGALKRSRIIKSYKICLLYSFSIAFVLGLILKFFGTQFLMLFTRESSVIECGLKRLNIMAFSYCFSAFMDCTIAASRGLGKTAIPTLIVIFGSCVFRIIWIYTVFAYFHTIPSLYLLYIFSWGITATLEIICFRHYYKKIVLDSIKKEW